MLGSDRIDGVDIVVALVTLALVAFMMWITP
jgi:hypothetical protein